MPALVLQMRQVAHGAAEHALDKPPSLLLPVCELGQGHLQQVVVDGVVGLLSELRTATKAGPETDPAWTWVAHAVLLMLQGHRPALPEQFASAVVVDAGLLS